MAPTSYKALPTPEGDWYSENRRPSETHRRAYDGLHSRHEITADARPMSPLAERSSNQIVMASSGRRDLQDHGRLLSPITSFLDQIPLRNGQAARGGSELHPHQDTGRKERDSKTHDEYQRRENHHVKSTSTSTPGNKLKRPALSPPLNSKLDSTHKFQRISSTDADSSSTHTARARNSSDMQKIIEQKIAQARFQVHELERMKEEGNAGKSQHYSCY